jgi:alkanesulfonate monooxygenase SsuD/methylene tetrahydromethanopterin reductase-like flavin-dependent oxidoreductase (luciferase family)
MPYLVTPEQLSAGLAMARAVAAEHGRPPVEGAFYAWAAVHPDGRHARRVAVEQVGGGYRQDFSRYADTYLVAGTPSDVVARLREYVDAGAGRILIASAAPKDDPAMARRFADEVLPALRS